MWTRRRLRGLRWRHGGPEVPAGPLPVADVRATMGVAGFSHVRSGVHLGFRDGTGLELAVEDPRVAVFRAVARTLRG